MLFQPVFRFRHAAKLVRFMYGDDCRKDLSVLNYRTQYFFSRFVRFYSSVESDVPNNDNLENNIIYNSSLHKPDFFQKKRLEKRAKKKAELESLKVPVPISLKYVLTPEEEANFGEDKIVKTEATEVPDGPDRLPYALKTSPRSSYVNSLQNENSSEKNKLLNNVLTTNMRSVDSLISDLPVKTAGKWMNDYEKYTEEEEEEDGEELESWRRDYGTPDPTVPVSKVPCGGCGAHLHCQDYAIPGFLPREIFVNCTAKDLQAAICQRCYFLQNYNTALSVTVDKEEYPRLLSMIKDEHALIILIADMTDLPHSIWPEILNIVGMKRPLFVVGNKLDLLWPDSKGWMAHALCCLKACLPVGANVKYISLISAKTGFGVEQLINKLHNIWQYKGDVYLVGCTNVGKSTLFNALLQSDYCKVKAVDLVQRATTAPWPGTTLNLLKFPILRPEGWRLYLRASRLQRQTALQNEEKALVRELKRATKSNKTDTPQLIGHIGRTFHQSPPPQDVEVKDSFSQGALTEPPGLGLDESDSNYKGTRWLFDTPGVLHEHQFLDLLTAEEVTLTLPKKTMEPRTFSMRVGWSLFVGGVARIDYVQGNNTIRLTVFSADTLPVTIVPLDKASEMYTRLIGTGYMAVPRGSQERLQTWPGLQLAAEAPLSGLTAEESCADISLSSAGWVSVTPRPKEVVRLAVWTPQGRGVTVRCPSLLPFAARLRGKKIRNLPAYAKSKPYIL